MRKPQQFATHRRRALRTGFWTGIVLGTTIGLVAVAVLPVIALAITAVGGAMWLALRSHTSAGAADYAFARDEPRTRT